ncbi:MAG TPA: aromatic ring-hydroxylating dioxygenase subunit alpha [Steroidobacteraceae bacterium]|jgi:phenylpropionate dioxygenase-like ring-hydroxylating dioxygenase large terminal subunit|nr:aromatic ring-hydroxylating dioxygenase subunit alpha [Steroidobacteraceae bacterium]
MNSVPIAASDPKSPLALAHALPAWVYNHAELTRLELERVLRPSWQIVCHVNSIPKAGDYATFDLGGESILALRDRDGSIRGFHNVCRHRGARLLDGSGNCPASITCPYHGWTYRHDGGLIGMPVRESFPGLDRSEHGLKPVRVDIAMSFVWVCLAGDPPPVAKVWGQLADELLPYRLQDMVPLGPITEEHWPVDWKLAMDNYLESYHVPIGHPGLFRMFTPDYDDQKGVPGVARGLSWMRDKVSSRWSEGLYQGLIGKAATHLPEDLRRCWRFYSALPNLGIDVFPDQMDFFQVLPNGPGRCIIRGAVFGLPDERREMRAARYLSSRINTQVNNEDRWLCSRVQRGLASGSYRPGPLSRLERWMLEFHDLLRERIPEFRLANPPEQFKMN